MILSAEPRGHVDDEVGRRLVAFEASCAAAASASRRTVTCASSGRPPGRPRSGSTYGASPQLLHVGDDELLASVRGDREDARRELVAGGVLEQRGVLLAMEEVLVGRACGLLLDDLALLPHRRRSSSRSAERRAGGSVIRNVPLERRATRGCRTSRCSSVNATEPSTTACARHGREPEARAVRRRQRERRLGLHREANGRRSDVEVAAGAPCDAEGGRDRRGRRPLVACRASTTQEDTSDERNRSKSHRAPHHEAPSPPALQGAARRDPRVRPSGMKVLANLRDARGTRRSIAKQMHTRAEAH